MSEISLTRRDASRGARIRPSRSSRRATASRTRIRRSHREGASSAGRRIPPRVRSGCAHAATRKPQRPPVQPLSAIMAASRSSGTASAGPLEARRPASPDLRTTGSRGMTANGRSAEDTRDVTLRTRGAGWPCWRERISARSPVAAQRKRTRASIADPGRRHTTRCRPLATRCACRVPLPARGSERRRTGTAARRRAERRSTRFRARALLVGAPRGGRGTRRVGATRAERRAAGVEIVDHVETVERGFGPAARTRIGRLRPRRGRRRRLRQGAGEHRGDRRGSGAAASADDRDDLAVIPPRGKPGPGRRVSDGSPRRARAVPRPANDVFSATTERRREILGKIAVGGQADDRRPRAAEARQRSERSPPARPPRPRPSRGRAPR